jgi:hypothetical protein
LAKGGPSKQTVTTSVDIPEFLRPYIEQSAAISNNALATVAPLLSQGNFIAPFNSTQNAGFQSAINAANGAGGFFDTAENTFLNAAGDRSARDLLDPASLNAFLGAANGTGPGSETLSRTANGDFLFGGAGFNAALDAANREAQKRVFSTFGAAGRSNGGLAEEAIARASSDAFANLFNANLDRQQGAANSLADRSLQGGGAIAEIDNTLDARRLQAAGILPELAFGRSNALTQIGDRRQAQEQEQLLSKINGLTQLVGLGQGVVPAGATLGNTETTTRPRSGSLAGSILGGLSLGAGILAAPMTGGTSLFGSLLGGGLSAGERGLLRRAGA